MELRDRRLSTNSNEIESGARCGSFFGSQVEDSSAEGGKEPDRQRGRCPLSRCTTATAQIQSTLPPIEGSEVANSIQPRMEMC